jgi:hypothetical protein
MICIHEFDAAFQLLVVRLTDLDERRFESRPDFLSC